MSSRVISNLASHRSVTLLKTSRFQTFLRLASSKNMTTRKPYTIELCDFAPSKLQLEFNRIATQVDKSVVATCEGTSVIVAAGLYSEKVKQDLAVEYKLRPIAMNRFDMHALKSPIFTRLAVLHGRAVDRSIRVCLPGKLPMKVDVLVLSYDLIGDHLLLAINGIHALLSMFNIPYNGPMAAVRVGCVDGQFILNPTAKQLRQSVLNLLLVVDEDKNIVMIEMSANNVPHGIVSDALDFGAEHGSKLAKNMKLYTTNPLCGQVYSEKGQLDPDFCSEWESSMTKALSKENQTKSSRGAEISKLYNKMEKGIESPVLKENIRFQAVLLKERVLHRLIANDNLRIDGRKCHEIRPLDCEVNYLSFPHGSARFQRGETQVVASVTLDEEVRQSLMTKGSTYYVGVEDARNFTVDYNFHSFCKSSFMSEKMEANSGSSRREIGHGSLVDKALRPLLPPDFPFSIKVTADVTDSSGSSSMASICAGSLALMDAGVQLSEPAAGVALGLSCTDPDDPRTFRILNDILGAEDMLGYMDFKVGGTRNGLSVCQLDLKIPGVPVSFIKRCFFLGQASIAEIINRMTSAAGITSPRPELKENAPILRHIKMSIFESSQVYKKFMTHRKLLEQEYGIVVSSDAEGLHLYAPSKFVVKEAEEDLESLLVEPPEMVENAIYEAKITGKSERSFLISIHPNLDDVLIPVSQVTTKPVVSTGASGYDIGDTMKVKYFGRDPDTGKMRFSRTALLIQSERTTGAKKGISLKDAVFDDDLLT